MITNDSGSTKVRLVGQTRESVSSITRRRPLREFQVHNCQCLRSATAETGRPWDSHSRKCPSTSIDNSPRGGGLPLRGQIRTPCETGLGLVLSRVMDSRVRRYGLDLRNSGRSEQWTTIEHAVSYKGCDSANSTSSVTPSHR